MSDYEFGLRSQGVSAQERQAAYLAGLANQAAPILMVPQSVAAQAGAFKIFPGSIIPYYGDDPYGALNAMFPPPRPVDWVASYRSMYSSWPIKKLLRHFKRENERLHGDERTAIILEIDRQTLLRPAGGVR